MRIPCYTREGSYYGTDIDETGTKQKWGLSDGCVSGENNRKKSEPESEERREEAAAEMEHDNCSYFMLGAAP
ncbi:hypothetical protein [Kineothrix sp. MB12-C1]|uniref:hypothetical protein n=1 Tax=Kineothrix sp. MB12-C1 TaxID=3070215 RepID=UPI0027D2DD4E|nr:hypothetical protein [Kineothrix sp. MB12-C1]WMC91859.1 hypothetical protein RBB56_13425 [Kineothrix sp. MB12-C1]